jgi:EmrB/QacA subfamily drug resistance transporter
VAFEVSAVEAPDPRRWKALGVVCLAFFMTVLDVSIVNVALPSIGRDLKFSSDDLQWVITAYAITFGGFLLLGGRAADLLGRRRIFVIGMILFTAASLACGLSSSEGVLIAARAIQGFGAALVSPAALSIVSTTFTEGAERNKALGIWGAVGGSGAAVGVLAGGILTRYFGWEWIFFVNVPVGIIVLILQRRLVRESKAEGIERGADPLGAIAITAGLALLVYAISNAPTQGWTSTRTIVLLLASVVLLVGFVVIESVVRVPLVRLSFFRHQTVSAANIVGFLLGATLFSNFFLLTLYVQQVLGYSALRAGLTFLFTAGTAVVVAAAAQAMTTKLGPKPVMAIGLALLGAGALVYTQLGSDSSFLSSLLPGYVLVGIGIPMAFIPISIAALAGVEPHEAGLASGLINTSQQIGGAIGVAVASTILFTHFNDAVKTGTAPPVALTDGVNIAFWVIAGVALVAVVAALTLVRSDEIPAGAEAAAGAV